MRRFLSMLGAGVLSGAVAASVVFFPAAPAAHAQVPCSFTVDGPEVVYNICKPAVNHYLKNNCGCTVTYEYIDDFGVQSKGSLGPYRERKAHCCGSTDPTITFDCQRIRYLSYWWDCPSSAQVGDPDFGGVSIDVAPQGKTTRGLDDLGSRIKQLSQ